jgi:hypothetical protein
LEVVRHAIELWDGAYLIERLSMDATYLRSKIEEQVELVAKATREGKDAIIAERKLTNLKDWSLSKRIGT